MPPHADARPRVLTSETRNRTSWRRASERIERERGRLAALGLPSTIVEVLVEEVATSPDVDPQTIGRCPEGRRALAYWRTVRNARDRQRRRVA